MTVAEVVGAQEPRVKVVPEGEDHPRWPEIKKFVKRLGYVLDPWQWMVLRAALMRKDGQWAAFTVAVCAPRQNGKNSLLEVLELVKGLLLGEKLIIHTAHLTDTSGEAFQRLSDLLEANEWLSKDVKHIRRSNGREAIEFTGGRRIRFRTRTAGGGRGYAGCSTAIFDEAMFLPEVSMGAIMPVISASPDPQIIYTGSAVDQEIMDDGVAFARVRERALNGDHERLAYFEWSLDAEAPDEVETSVLADPLSWAQTNPALGLRIQPSYIKEEIANLDSRTFSVERLGVGDWPPTSTTETVIDIDAWDALTDEGSEMRDPVVLAFDVAPNRKKATICAAGRREDTLFHLETAVMLDGTGRVVEMLRKISKEQDVAGIYCDGYGPAGTLVSDLVQQGVPVTTLNTTDYGRACGLFFDSVQEKTFRHLGSPEMRSALKGAKARELGDAWAWTRKKSAADITPLVAATVALWGAQSLTIGEGGFAFA